MNYWALSGFVKKLKNNGKEFKKWLVDLHFKSEFAFSNILMILLTMNHKHLMKNYVMLEKRLTNSI